MPECLRCGRCCHFFLDGKLHKCNMLVKLKNGKTLCRIYKTRLGRVLGVAKDGRKMLCNNREDVKLDWFCCPFNKGYELVDVWGECDKMKESTIKSILSEKDWFLFRIYVAGKGVYFKGNDLHYYVDDFKAFCKIHNIKL
jgi:hypothetical protein